MKSMTIVVQFEEGQKPDKVNFDSVVCGGRVSAIAAYDVVHTMEIAEEALDKSDDNCCIQAKRKIDDYIINRMKS